MIEKINYYASADCPILTTLGYLTFKQLREYQVTGNPILNGLMVTNGNGKDCKFLGSLIGTKEVVSIELCKKYSNDSSKYLFVSPESLILVNEAHETFEKAKNIKEGQYINGFMNTYVVKSVDFKEKNCFSLNFNTVKDKKDSFIILNDCFVQISKIKE